MQPINRATNNSNIPFQWVNNHWNLSQYQQRVSELLRVNNSQGSMYEFCRLADEAFHRQLNTLWLNEDEKTSLRQNLLPNIWSGLQFFESHEGEIQDNSKIMGYLSSPDIDQYTQKNDYLSLLCNPNKTHIGIYLWRISDKNELINTMNHEINHLYLRYITTLRSIHKNEWNFHRLMNSDSFWIILECFWFLSWAEAGIMSGSYTHLQWIDRAGKWSNGDVYDKYTLWSLLAQRLLAVQILIWEQMWSSHSKFIQFCNEYRQQLTQCISKPDKLNKLMSILQIWEKTCTINNNLARSVMDWAKDM